MSGVNRAATATAAAATATRHNLYRLSQAGGLQRVRPHPGPPTSSQTTTSIPRTLASKAPSSFRHSVINLDRLTQFAAGILRYEANTIAAPARDIRSKLSSADMTKKCNVAEWGEKLYGPAAVKDKDESRQAERQEALKKKEEIPTSKLGVIYATTIISEPGHEASTHINTSDSDSSQADQRNSKLRDLAASGDNNSDELDEDEQLTSFLFAEYKDSIPELQVRLKTDLVPPPNPNNQDDEEANSLTSVPSRIQKLIEEQGVTHLWLCGTDPAHRRQHIMTECLRHLEQDVREWKQAGSSPSSTAGAAATSMVSTISTAKDEGTSSPVSGILTVHTYPLRFPGMVQFLIKNEFKGGDRIKTAEDKVFYWKELK